MQSEASLCNFCNYRTGSNTKRGCKCSQRHGRKRPPSQALLPLLAPAEPPGSQWVLGPAPALDNGGLRLCLGLSASAEVPTPRSRPAHRSDAAARPRGIVPGSCHVLPSPPRLPSGPGVGLLTAKPPARPGGPASKVDPPLLLTSSGLALKPGFKSPSSLAWTLSS